MTTGDDALLAGIPLVPGSAPASDIDEYINRLADEIARRTMATLSVSRGGTGATTPPGARLNLEINARNVPNKDGGSVQADLDYLGERVGDTFRRGETYGRGVIDSAFSSRDSGINAALRGNLYPDSYNRNITGTRRAAWIQDNGQLGYASSSERYKKYVRPEDVSDETVLMLALVSFQWKAAVAIDDRREMGLIAERLIEAGLGWACFFNPAGEPEGINYDMIGLALLPAVQRLIAARHRHDDDLDAAADRIAELEQRLSRLEGQQ